MSKDIYKLDFNRLIGIRNAIDNIKTNLLFEIEKKGENAIKKTTELLDQIDEELNKTALIVRSDETLLTKAQWKKYKSDKKRSNVNKVVDAIEELATVASIIECDKPRFGGQANPTSKLLTEEQRNKYQEHLGKAFKNVVKKLLEFV